MYDQLVTIELDPLVLGLHQDNDVAAQVNHPVPHVALYFSNDRQLWSLDTVQVFVIKDGSSNCRLFFLGALTWKKLKNVFLPFLSVFTFCHFFSEKYYNFV